MLKHLSQLLANVATTVRPQDLLLTRGSWVYFTNKHKKKWASGKLFEVNKEPILVNYPVSYVLPGDDYKEIDLSNATNGLNLYPEEEKTLYEIGVGFKDGEYIVHIWIPTTDSYIYRLNESTMYPAITNATLKYLGAFNPETSPAKMPLLYFYVIKDIEAFHLTPYVLELVDFEKVTIEFKINKCKLAEIIDPTDEQIAASLQIPYYEQLRGW